MAKAGYGLAVAFCGLMGLWMLASHCLRERKGDRYRPAQFLTDLDAEGDVDEDGVAGEIPRSVSTQTPRVWTPRRVAFASACLALMALGGWFGLRTVRIVRGLDAAGGAMAAHDYPGAEMLARKALAIDPLVRASHRLLAEALLQEGKLDSAVTEFRAAAVGENRDPEIYIELGDALQIANRLSEAPAAYQKAIDIVPKRADPYVRLGSCLVKMNRHADAVRELKYAVELNPKDVKANANLGCELLVTGDPNGGLIHLRKAVELAPNDVDAHDTLATAYARCKLYADAVNEYRAELAINPEYANGYFNMGGALKLAGRYQEAIDAYRAFLRVAPGNPEAEIALPRARQEIVFLHRKLHPAR